MTFVSTTEPGGVTEHMVTFVSTTEPGGVTEHRVTFVSIHKCLPTDTCTFNSIHINTLTHNRPDATLHYMAQSHIYTSIVHTNKHVFHTRLT